MFMHARDEDSGERMNDAQLRDEVVTMLLAGHETTAVALTWTRALLDVHREAQARLHEELARVLGGRAPAAADVSSLPYARAVMSEALHLHPPAVSRQPRRACRRPRLRRARAPRGLIVLSPQPLVKLTKALPEVVAPRSS